ncbi:UNKNOWN [Stylonychia lemnae]|uniref:Uncharacterized protein n=1 Tax=Stylonychia lemnae TaxID=5949 RepID=A0A077ZU61_STYLE|nr:UNKNOWN [Stylonychia lemnae]|eukprot:CDW72001.1 UNKNOWN [Stylonychia lemnae]
MNKIFGNDYQYYVAPAINYLFDAFRGIYDGTTGTFLMNPLFCLVSGYYTLSQAQKQYDLSLDYPDSASFSFDSYRLYLDQCQILNTPLVNTGSILFFREPIKNYLQTAPAILRLLLQIHLSFSAITDVIAYFTLSILLPSHYDQYNLIKLLMRILNSVSIIYYFAIIPSIF